MVIANPDINPLFGVTTEMGIQFLPNITHHSSHAQVNTSASFQIPCPHPKVSCMCQRNGDKSEAAGKLLIG
jgi:hypothetical protein